MNKYTFVIQEHTYHPNGNVTAQHVSEIDFTGDTDLVARINYVVAQEILAYNNEGKK